jgi:hypothetical protein
MKAHKIINKRRVMLTYALRAHDKVSLYGNFAFNKEI